MKPLLSFSKGLLPHVVLILSLMMLTFFIIDLYNPAMAFLSNTITKILLAIFSVLALILAILFLVEKTKNN